MYAAQLNFHHNNNVDEASAVETINSFLGSLRMNGQILGREFSLICYLIFREN